MYTIEYGAPELVDKNFGKKVFAGTMLGLLAGVSLFAIIRSFGIYF